jgi:NADPH:quinone reductase-like Zn-dependent oxidoreductase
LATARGVRTIATAGSKEKCDACLEFGAFEAINYKEDDFVDRVFDATDGKGVFCDKVPRFLASRY